MYHQKQAGATLEDGEEIKMSCDETPINSETNLRPDEPVSV
jgi:hypothetical protein